jgi:DNA-binding CsgD family transcriptional regulator
MSHRNCIARDKAGPDWPHHVTPILNDLERFMRASIDKMRELEQQQQQRQQRERRQETELRVRQQRRAARLQRNQEIVALRSAGYGYKKIARQLSISRDIARNVCRAAPHH